MTFASLRSWATPEMIACSMSSLSFVTQVPSRCVNDERTWMGMSERRAYSTQRRCRTFAPAAASSSISSYDTRSRRRALATMRGSAE